jgi:threonine/homoserine/homoserine lactone efflux protein
MNTQSIILFLTVMIPVIWSAGPNNLMCASIGGKYGAIKAIPFIIGVNFAMLVYCLIVGFGFETIVEKYPISLTVINYAGIAYIFYLAYKFFTAKEGTKTGDSLPKFRDGFIISISSVKSITAVALMYSQFLNKNANETFQITILTIAYLILCIIGHFGWAVIGKWFSKLMISRHSLKIQNIIFGILLLIVGFWSLLS